MIYTIVASAFAIEGDRRDTQALVSYAIDRLCNRPGSSTVSSLVLDQIEFFAFRRLSLSFSALQWSRVYSHAVSCECAPNARFARAFVSLSRVLQCTRWHALSRLSFVQVADQLRSARSGTSSSRLSAAQASSVSLSLVGQLPAILDRLFDIHRVRNNHRCSSLLVSVRTRPTRDDVLRLGFPSTTGSRSPSSCGSRRRVARHFCTNVLFNHFCASANRTPA